MSQAELISREAALAIAQEEHDSIVALTQALIKIPTQGGIDTYDPILELMHEWLSNKNLSPQVLRNQDNSPVALVCELSGAQPGPRYVLDACLDTAPFGNEKAWSTSPTSGEIRDGWLYGRGASDSKSGAAVFAHIAARLVPLADRLQGGLVLLFDVDEHTGNFGGAKAFFGDNELRRDVAGVMIGYPGNEHVVVGGRGVLRAYVHVRGVSSHSGGSKATPNAISKAAELITLLSRQSLPQSDTSEFPKSPKLTVTKVDGGEGFSVTPDLCTVSVDIRLTPEFDPSAARKVLDAAVNEIDQNWPETPSSDIEVVMEWPPYQLPTDSRLSSSLLSAAREFGMSPDAYVAGPSNIGNYIFGFGIPSTAGFGAVYQGLHATDERIQLSSLPSVHATYLRAITQLLS